MEIKVTYHTAHVTFAHRKTRSDLKHFTPGVDWQFSDCGQNAAGVHDTNNCSVRAYVAATDARFVDADAAMELCGRQRNKGSSIYLTIGRMSKLLGFGYIDMETMVPCMRTSRYSGQRYESSKRQTVHTFLKNNPTGRFVCTISHHAFAVVAGKVIDGHRWSKLSHIDGIYKVTEARAEWAA